MSRVLTGVLAATGAAGMIAAGAQPAAAAPSALQVDPCVQRIVVSNNSGGILSYVLSTREGVTNTATDQYPVNQWRTTDLTTTEFAEGTDLRPIVSVQAGDTVPAPNFVSFCANGQTATYIVTGTINDINIALIG
jgi:hypothetical protein